MRRWLSTAMPTRQGRLGSTSTPTTTVASCGSLKRSLGMALPDDSLDPAPTDLVIPAQAGIQTRSCSRVSLLALMTLLVAARALTAGYDMRGDDPGPSAGRTYTNPVIDEIGPADPHVILFEGTYYLYPTGGNRSYHVYTSTDLVHWTKGRRVFEPGERNVWAPDVFHDPSDNKFYLYYTVNKRIGVAVADRLDGTFEDRATLFQNAIDAHMFCDNGRYYLYYVQLPGFRIHVQRMKTPLTKDGDPIEIIRPTEPWEKIRGAVTEGPWMLKHKGTYYLLYSGTGANSLDYAIGYATAAEPAGPFTKHPGNPIVHRTDVAFGPGHGCVVTDAAGNLWSVYHQQKDDTRPWNRFICIDPLWFDDNGILHGKATRGSPQPAPAVPSSTP